MFRVTIGQYYPANSFIHALDPRLKLTWSISFIILLFTIPSIASYLLAALFLGICIAVSKVPFRLILRGLRGILFLLLFTVSLNMFLMPGQHLIFSFWFITIYEEGLTRAIMMAIRLVMLIFSSSLLTLTTPPIALTSAIEFLLTPFKIVKVPAAEIAMMMTIALRFIPTLAEEMDKIMKAQKARGADFESGSLVQRATNLVPLLIPLFISSFRRADDLAMAMEARCYQPDKTRTHMKVNRLNKFDVIALIVILISYAIIYIPMAMGLWLL